MVGVKAAPNSKKSIGWEYVHVCVDDASRLAFSQIHPDETAQSAVAHLRAAIAWCASMGVTVRRVMTDNGGCYRSRAFAAACAELSVRHIRTKPYTPRTNGKAERFIQTALREWAYAGLFFDFVLAFLAHWNISDGEFAPSLVAMALLGLSYFFGKAMDAQRPSVGS